MNDKLWTLYTDISNVLDNAEESDNWEDEELYSELKNAQEALERYLEH